MDGRPLVIPLFCIYATMLHHGLKLISHLSWSTQFCVYNLLSSYLKLLQAFERPAFRLLQSFFSIWLVLFLTVFLYTMSSTISSTTGVTNTSSASATCTTAVPGKHGYIPPEACNAIYMYYPSFGAAILFTGLFGLVTGFHIFQAAKFKKVRFLMGSLRANLKSLHQFRHSVGS